MKSSCRERRAGGCPPALPRRLAFGLAALAATLFQSVSPSWSGTATLFPESDAYIRAGSPNLNQGSAAFVQVQNDGNHRSLVRFSGDAITAALAGGALESAALLLFVEDSANWSSGRTVDAHRLLAPWSEATATWNCGSDADLGNSSADCATPWQGGEFAPQATASVLHVDTTAGFVAFDVTADVAAILAGAVNHGWLVKKTDESRNGLARYTSREGAPAQWPRLVLAFQDTGPPAGGGCSQAAPANDCVAGGGPKQHDCLIEWLPSPSPPRDRKGLPLRRLVCHEGDPLCDIDPVLNNQSCTFPLRLCINNADPRLPECAATGLTTLEALKPGRRVKTATDAQNLAVLEGLAGSAGGLGVTVVRRDGVVFNGAPNGEPNACTPLFPLVVPQRLTTVGPKPRTSAFRIRGAGVGNLIDVDTIRLQCRPSTCGNSVVEAHETCDDGNRLAGDGCNAGCRIESITPTPTLMATVTATPTPTGPTPTQGPPTETPTITGTPTETPTPGGIVCGDGLLSGGETCATCAADCVVGPCSVPSPAPTVTFRVNWAPPFGIDASSVGVLVAYRDTLMSLPGSGSAPASRITNRPSNAIVAVNDLDYAVRVVVTRSGAIAPGRLFHVNLDRCSAAPVPSVADLACTIEGCASAFGDIDGCTCEVVLP